jgi:hypothetical protein
LFWFFLACGKSRKIFRFKWVVMVNFWHMKNQQNFKCVCEFKNGFGNFLACVESLQEESPFPKFVYFSFSQMVFSSFSSSYERFSSSSSYNE